MNLVEIKNEINEQLGDKETFNTLVATTFKGLQPSNVKRAILEGVIRGFTFKDFLEKNIYAIPFKDSYSLVTSIDYARKVGMRSGVVGTTPPVYHNDGDTIVSCTITVKRKIGEYIGDYSATVYFKEYNTGKNLWASKPHTMIAKVAEMHALRKACPEELSQAYVEEEMQSIEKPNLPIVNMSSFREKLESAKNMEELGVVWSAIPVEAKAELEALKNELKVKFNENTKVSG